MTNFIRQVRAHEGETVEIKWLCRDGSAFYQRLTIAPPAVRDALAGERNAAGQVTNRGTTSESGQKM